MSAKVDPGTSVGVKGSASSNGGAVTLSITLGGGQAEAPAGDFPNPPGLTALVEETTEYPSIAMANILRPGEEIISQFDVYIPKGALSPAMKTFLWIVTLGLFGIWLLLKSCEAWCQRRRWCTPTLITYKRAKMAVTNKGRAICWTSGVTQQLSPSQKASLGALALRAMFPAIFQQPVTFEADTETHIYNLQDVRQVTQSFTSTGPCSCCLDYQAGVEMAFDRYDYSDRDSAFLDASPGSDFLSKVKKLVDDSTEVLFNFVGVYTNDNIIRVHGNSYDQVHYNDVHKALEELSSLHAKVLDCLPVQPDVFMPFAGPSGLNEAATRATQWLTADRDDVQVVNDSGEVKLPKRWVPLLPSETIVGVMGQIYKMKSYDWVFTILTLGLYYLFFIRRKKFQRSATVISTKRIVEVLINQRAGTIPTHLSNFTVRIRSFFPQTINSGYISGRKRRVVSAIRSVAGELSLEMPKTQIAFARAMHFTASRGFPLDVPIAPSKDSDTAMDDLERDVVPIMGDEKLIKRLNGGSAWEPCCTDNKALVAKCNEACVFPGNEKGVGVFSRQTLGMFFPCIPWCLSCGFRPFFRRNDMLVTNKALYLFKSRRNYPVCSCCATLDSYTVAWVPIREFKSTKLHVNVKGDETVFKRLAYHCGKSSNCIRVLSSWCCPVMTSKYVLDVRVGEFSFRLSEDANNKNWNVDADLKETRDILGAVQVAIADDLRAKSNKV